MPAKKKTKKKTRSARKAPAATTAIVEATPVQPPAPILSTVRPHTWTNHGDEVLILKRVNPDRTARGGFKYPAGVGSKVEPESWDSSPSCGEGLHGWPWGFGLGEGMNYDPLEDIWLVLGAKPEDVVGELEGGQKCKCRHATIRYEGCFAGALALIREGFHACIVEMSKVVIPPGGAPSPTASDRYRAYLAASGGYSQLAASGGYSQLAASGGYSRLAASGGYSRLAASGHSSQLAASGHSSQLAASGGYSQLAASGGYSQLAASGGYSRLAASGHSSQLAASGHSSRLAASGGYSQLAASGGYSRLAASGHSSQLAASGHSSQLAASGGYSQLAASGGYSRLAASGGYSQLAASGGYSQLAASGRNSIAVSSGLNSRVKVGENGVFALCYWAGDDKGYEILVGKVGVDGIKADTWYVVRDGKIVAE